MAEQQTYKRWYDHDPILLELINLLKDYQAELKVQAQLFLEKLEERVSKETIDSFYEKVKPVNGKRWYDKDPVISKTVELLRIVPPDLQQQTAKKFLKTLEDMGIVVEKPADSAQ